MLLTVTDEMRNGPFRVAIRPISQCEMGRIAPQNRPFYSVLYINTLQIQDIHTSADGITYEKDASPMADGMSQSVTSKRYSPDCTV